MKTSLLLLLFIHLSFSCFAQNISALDVKYGFRQAKFEMPLNSFSNMKKIEGNWYKSTTEDLNFGNWGKLQEVRYYFYKDRLTSIRIEIDEKHINSFEFVQTFVKAYGTPTKKNEDKIGGYETWIWNGKKVEMYIAFPPRDRSNNPNPSTFVYLRCIKLINQEELDKKTQEIKEAKKKL
jgi:hypothetical protein